MENRIPLRVWIVVRAIQLAGLGLVALTLISAFFVVKETGRYLLNDLNNLTVCYQTEK